eukprot:SAG31_NODE_17007_length_686_cov_4.340716_1_plen_108_part_10
MIQHSRRPKLTISSSVADLIDDMYSNRRSIISPHGHDREHDSLFSSSGQSAAGVGSRSHAAPTQRHLSWIGNEQCSDDVNMTQVLSDRIKEIFQKRSDNGAYSLDAYP